MTLDEDVEWLLRPDSGPLSGLKEATRPAAPQATEPASYGLISGPELASLLGIEARSVLRHANSGVVVRAQKGSRSGPAMYDLERSVRSYCRWLADRATRHSDDDPLKLEKIRQAKAAAEKLELHNAAARGELVTVEEVARRWADIVHTVRAGLLAVPARCQTAGDGVTPELRSVIDREIRRALEDLDRGA